jgi:hypothetical protein
MLTREEEEHLGLEIAEHRERIRRWLRARPRLVRHALEGLGRGVVHPEEDFREREALVVLNHARGKLQTMSRRQRGRKTLRKLVADLEREMETYRELRDRMMTANVRLVMTLARRYRHPTLSFLDLVQEKSASCGPSRVRTDAQHQVQHVCRLVNLATDARAADCQGLDDPRSVHWNQLRRSWAARRRQRGPGDPDSVAGGLAGASRRYAIGFRISSDRAARRRRSALGHDSRRRPQRSGRRRDRGLE